ncbi:hypothetical protein GS982_13015 [Rhodococcus hoagii]|uniref:Uncharacterized protein n=1 Tax=Rhodococcus hoagii TaxID=43767 RepID=A0A9Q2PL06_RHOHA|nr:hypothetical protein [Prescottella equi]MBM4487436.1 hypothetical protein [Prescottella equi]MBM4497126.1 hypothetical protein [Prescottella equi]MBM4497624.1 hypothetical protein [Prescottella equi]MBM4508895.1 hypothetical protein [Prescottella equi]MBM4509060.1 hypothetical protein [Prescottella equi]
MTEYRLRLHMYWLILDWVNLATNLPTPARRGAAGRAAPTREYGHPAEWASDTSALIAATLHGWHDALAEHRGETPPPSIATAESVRVAAAWHYLDPRAQALLDYAGEDPADEIRELHNKIRSALGHTRPRHVLPTPCPRADCGLRTLTRTTGMAGQPDFILCEVCGYAIRDGDYPGLIRAALDTIIDQLEPERVS